MRADSPRRLVTKNSVPNLGSMTARNAEGSFSRPLSSTLARALPRNIPSIPGRGVGNGRHRPTRLRDTSPPRSGCLSRTEPWGKWERRPLRSTLLHFRPRRNILGPLLDVKTDSRKVSPDQRPEHGFEGECPAQDRPPVGLRCRWVATAASRHFRPLDDDPPRTGRRSPGGAARGIREREAGSRFNRSVRAVRSGARPEAWDASDYRGASAESGRGERGPRGNRDATPRSNPRRQGGRRAEKTVEAPP